MLFDVLVSGTKLHFTILEISGEYAPFRHVTIVVIWSVQYCTFTLVVPPSIYHYPCQVLRMAYHHCYQMTKTIVIRLPINR